MRAGQAFVSPLDEALQKYENERKKTLFNQGVFDIMKGKTDSAGNPYIPVEAIARWDSLNPDKQAGYLAAAGSSIKEDMQKAAQKRQDALAEAQANLANAKANQAWTGQDADSTLNLSPDEINRAQTAGVVPLRQSKGSFQYREDPNNPVNMGQAPPTPIMDPRDPTKMLGLQDARGGVKYFPKPSTLQEAMDLGLIPPTNKPAAPPPSAASPIQPQRSPQDAAALAWAHANPQDPRSAAILKKLGMQ